MLFALGEQYSDRITGFSGTATAEVKRLDGTWEAFLEPMVNATQTLDARWVAVERLESFR